MAPGLIVASHRETQTTSARDWLPEKNQVPASPPNPNTRAKPLATIVVTTPNREYNVKWETLPAGKFRHRDHRFEWTRVEFQDWANRVAASTGYRTRFLPVGPEDSTVGSPTQMAIFTK